LHAAESDIWLKFLGIVAPPATYFISRSNQGGMGNVRKTDAASGNCFYAHSQMPLNDNSQLKNRSNAYIYKVTAIL